MKLTHLMFADNLILFCGATQFVYALMEQFQRFSSCSGLKANEDKCEIYFTGVDDNVEHNIYKALGIRNGSLPFRYLGIPLASRKLEYGECKVLADKITQYITHCFFLMGQGFA